MILIVTKMMSCSQVSCGYMHMLLEKQLCNYKIVVVVASDPGLRLWLKYGLIQHGILNYMFLVGV